MILTIIVFALILSVLVLVHEMGHFIVARNRGVKVEEFGFGFPPRLFSKKRGETVYSFNAIPFGGFVKLYGEDGNKDSENGDMQRAFFSKKIWERSAIIIAGVIMNIILAVFLLGLGHWIGLPTVLDESNKAVATNTMIQVIQVASDSPASEAGIKMGDSIERLKIENGKLKIINITNINQVQETISEYRGKEIVIGISRGDEVVEMSIVPRINPPEGEGAIGIVMSEVGFISYPWYVAIWKGIESTFLILLMIFSAIIGLIKTLIIGAPMLVELSDVAGPVGIAVWVHQLTKLGIVYILQFAAIISINLAIINIFPFPAIDGGRLVFLFIEKIKGSPVNQKIEGMIHQIGFALLILLMIFITFKDVSKFF